MLIYYYIKNIRSIIMINVKFFFISFIGLLVLESKSISAKENKEQINSDQNVNNLSEAVDLLKKDDENIIHS
ncbi:hypothetical protein P618_200228 [Holospora obtusa F1]|uniref:Uncharacterized protein n=2 Tax=Holospora obtusa TaxID=49893 RepID=W6TUZ7_HOLOB|nr:hypothetical protein P618_200228 [Holospora obtusa F1]